MIDSCKQDKRNFKYASLFSIFDSYIALMGILSRDSVIRSSRVDSFCIETENRQLIKREKYEQFLNNSVMVI